jgi:signal transduction histidine kinase
VNVAARFTETVTAHPGARIDIGDGFFGFARRVMREHPLATDGVVAGALLAASTIWLVLSPFATLDTALVQIALIVPLVWRRSQPTVVFLFLALIGLFEWLFGLPLIANGALLVALYTVAVHESRARALAGAAILELGAIMAAMRWDSAGTLLRSLTFLSATVLAAYCAGLTVRSSSQYMSWLSERAERLEVERDQRISLAAAEERTRIAREMHDIVAHSLSVVVSLTDAATTVSRSDPDRAADAMRYASTVGRQALVDMRSMIGVLRTDSVAAEFVPQPGLAQLDGLIEQVRAVGLDVEIDTQGDAFSLGPAAELSVYRIVQESLTNVLKHAATSGAHVNLCYEQPVVTVCVMNNTPCSPRTGGKSERCGGVAVVPSDVNHVDFGHGLEGMQERVALHAGSLRAGPTTNGGWCVTATLRPDRVEATQ